jgi:integrase
MHGFGFGSGAVLRTDENRTICRVAMFLLSTGCRLNEALQATWAQVDRPNRVWRIPASNSKSKKIRLVPLNDSALEVLDELKTEGRIEYLFVNEKTKGPYTTIMKVWSRLRSQHQVSAGRRQRCLSGDQGGEPCLMPISLQQSSGSSRRRLQGYTC